MKIEMRFHDRISVNPAMPSVHDSPPVTPKSTASALRAASTNGSGGERSRRAGEPESEQHDHQPEEAERPDHAEELRGLRVVRCGEDLAHDARVDLVDAVAGDRAQHLDRPQGVEVALGHRALHDGVVGAVVTPVEERRREVDHEADTDDRGEGQARDERAPVAHRDELQESRREHQDDAEGGVVHVGRRDREAPEDEPERAPALPLEAHPLGPVFVDGTKERWRLAPHQDREQARDRDHVVRGQHQVPRAAQEVVRQERVEHRADEREAPRHAEVPHHVERAEARPGRTTGGSRRSPPAPGRARTIPSPSTAT